MNKLWAPWRSHDLMEKGYKKWDCLFCGLKTCENKEDNLILNMADMCFTVMNLYPYNTGHIMIAPYRHTAQFESLMPEELKSINNELQQAVTILKKVYNPDGFNIGINLGTAAGAGVAEHLHYHIVPRWTGDSNFITSIGDTRVISVDVEREYKKLLKPFSEK